MFCQAVVFGAAAWYNRRSMQHTNASKTVRLPSLVETISEGFGAVNRRLWVLLIPVVLDLFYWLGPRLSLQPLAERTLALMRALNPQAADAAQWQQLEQQMITPPAPIDLSPLHSLANMNMLPKFLNLLTPLIQTPPPPLTPVIWHVGSIPTLFGTIALINLVSLVAITLYLVPLADAVRGRGEQQQGWRPLLRVFGSLLSIVVLLTGVLLLVIVPFGLAFAIVTPLNFVLGQLIATFGIALVCWLLFTASFSFDAVVISSAGPLRALLTSLLVVQRSFWSALGLFLIGWVILWGMSLVWSPLAATTAGLLAAVLGSAYLSSGLAAAHLIFYRDRLSRSVRRA